jgi:hypothetical protein
VNESLVPIFGYNENCRILGTLQIKTRGRNGGGCGNKINVNIYLKKKTAFRLTDYMRMLLSLTVRVVQGEFCSHGLNLYVLDRTSKRGLKKKKNGWQEKCRNEGKG